METFAERLKWAIDKKGISQAEAARKSHISQQSMNYIIKSNLESSKLAPQIASALNVNPEWLIYGRGKFEETKVYELPILNSPYMLFKFLHNDIDENVIKHTLVDIDLGDKAFAYLVEPKKMAICSSTDEFHPLQYLTLTTSAVTVTNNRGELSFAIFEWRDRHVNF